MHSPQQMSAEGPTDEIPSPMGGEGPTESGMLAKIGELIDISDLETVTIKVIRKQLEEHFGQSFDKKVVKELVTQFLCKEHTQGFFGTGDREARSAEAPIAKTGSAGRFAAEAAETVTKAEAAVWSMP